LKNLDNVDNQRLEAILRWDKDTHDAIQWVRANKHLFRMEVFETPFMRLTINNKRYTDAVEGCIAANHMKVGVVTYIFIYTKLTGLPSLLQSFVAQCQDDCDTLNRCINDEGVLGRKARVTTWFRPTQPETLVPPPMSPEEVNFGLLYLMHLCRYILPRCNTSNLMDMQWIILTARKE